jgi:molybdopterin-guanine dinucleotide biosynthesis protein MobB
MKVFGVTGWKNSGKTTLVVKLVECLTARGYQVSTLKHAHHHFDIDHQGTDSFRHREAGAAEVLVASEKRWALVHEVKTHEAGQYEETPLQEFIAKMKPVDLLLVEGFKQEDFAKLMVVRPEHNIEPLPADVTNLVAIASNTNIDKAAYKVEGPLLDLNNVDVIADFVVEYCQL